MYVYEYEYVKCPYPRPSPPLPPQPPYVPIVTTRSIACLTDKQEILVLDVPLTQRGVMDPQVYSKAYTHTLEHNPKYTSNNPITHLISHLHVSFIQPPTRRAESTCLHLNYLSPEATISRRFPLCLSHPSSIRLLHHRQQ